MSAAGNILAGAEILAEWLGDGGKPVPVELAEARAAVCVGCPMNVSPLWWENMALNPIANRIKAHLAKRQELGLSVSVESQLAMCRACGCCLPLKVHVPLHHVRDHTPDEVRSRLPDHCWMKTESL